VDRPIVEHDSEHDDHATHDRNAQGRQHGAELPRIAAAGTRAVPIELASPHPKGGGTVKRRISMAVAVAALAAFSSPAMAGAASAPSVRVSPHNRLTNDEAVVVRWKGFHDHSERFVMIYECRPNVDTLGMSACSTLYGDTTRGRRQERTVHVATGTIGLGDGTCGTTTTDRDCVILVVGETPRSAVISMAHTPIRFVVPE
jgi:hypothetical protein